MFGGVEKAAPLNVWVCSYKMNFAPIFGEKLSSVSPCNRAPYFSDKHRFQRRCGQGIAPESLRTSISSQSKPSSSRTASVC